jgi:hypothetical protein
MYLLLIQHHQTKAYGRVEVWLYAFLISALDSDECSASRSGRFIPRERAVGAQCIEAWMCSRAAVVTVLKSQLSAPPDTERRFSRRHVHDTVINSVEDNG